MAEDLGQERTERASPKRLREARERGQVPRSRELNTMVLLLAAGGAFLLLGPALVRALGVMMAEGFSINRELIFNPQALGGSLSQSGLAVLAAFAPLLLLLLLVAAVAPLALGGWTLSAKAVSINWERLDPIQGLKRIFAWRGLVELMKSLAKFALLATVTGWLLWYQANALLELGTETPAQALAGSANLLAWSFVVLCAALIMIAFIDVPFQLWDYARQLRMTRQELREELKETEGKPEVRAQIRKLQRQFARVRMMSQVPKSDVILTNPTHVAVALRYDAQRMRAPRVVAKGAELIAAQIRNIGERHKVPILSAPPLARALYRSTELNQEIPVGLYLAVAQVLSYVYQLRAHGVDEPMPEIAVPPEFQRD